MRQGDFGNHVPGLTQLEVNSLADIEALLSTADRNRYCEHSTNSIELYEHCSNYRKIFCEPLGQISSMHKHERTFVTFTYDACCEHGVRKQGHRGGGTGQAKFS